MRKNIGSVSACHFFHLGLLLTIFPNVIINRYQDSKFVRDFIFLYNKYQLLAIFFFFI